MINKKCLVRLKIEKRFRFGVESNQIYAISSLVHDFRSTYFKPQQNSQKHDLCSATMWTPPLESTLRNFHLSGHTFRFRWTVQDLEVFRLV